jgi:REP element-mobilizing transposase RayT
MGTAVWGRRMRMECAGVCYHVIGRGNYRKGLFVEKGIGKRFEETLMETMSRCGWRLLGYWWLR